MYLLKHETPEEEAIKTLFEKYGAMGELSKKFPSFKATLENL